MRILLVDDDPLVLKTTAKYLEEQLGHQVSRYSNGQEALEQFKKNPFPMVLSDIRMPGMDGLELLKRLKVLPEGQETDVVLITGFADLNSTIAALRGGAFDYLRKPVNIVELEAIVRRIVEHRSLLKDNYELTARFEEKVTEATQETKLELDRLKKAYAEVVGVGRIGFYSKSMQEVLSKAEKLHKDRSVPVLIEGETGTGKEVIARLVHYGSGDVTTPFVSINCSAISPNLFESELFGYEAGSYTGAKKAGQMGKLELALGGTIFLDEIGDMPLDMQPKLLRLLQEREFFRVGGLKNIKLDIRIICATNRDLVSLVKERSFRIDLFYRLNVGRINIPSLRERKKDIRPLALMFLQRFAEQKNSRFRSIHKEAERILENYSWPGNVRELQNAIERVLLWYDDTEIRPEHLQFLVSEGQDTSLSQDFMSVLDTLNFPPDGLNLKKVEERILQKALKMFDGNKSKAALYLGVTRSTYSRRVDNLD